MLSQSTRHSEVVPSPIAMTADQERALRSVQLELLAELDRLCKAHGLQYFALYGTLLGAVRHHGFIPWDDDLDVGMLRPDFDRLTEIVNSGLDAQYFFQTVDTDPHYGCMFGKLRKNGTRAVDRISYGSPQHGGIFIDVFPIDAKASRPLARIEQHLMRNVGFRFLYLKAGYLFMRGTSLPSRVAQAIVRAIGWLTPRRAILALMNRHTHLGETTTPRAYVSLFGAYVYNRDTIDATWIHPLTELPFEGTTIPVFADSESYLTQIYGDWRKPPPPALQVGHHDLVELDFGSPSS